MIRTAIIGGGVSGMTVARLLPNTVFQTTVFESDNKPGGLIKCERIDGSLFHTCGGHVFNTKYPEVSNFFWRLFDKDEEFVKADRNSVVKMPDGKEIPYPIENHSYMLDDEVLKAVIEDIAKMHSDTSIPDNFQDFLRKQFGPTLYNLYFGPYNRKIWRRDLSDVPLSWLEGKLPMPTPEEIIYNNIRKVKEKAFVHSSFFYEKENGSQFLADRLSEGLNIKYSTPIQIIERTGKCWNVNNEEYDVVIFTGNIQHLPKILKGIDLKDFVNEIDSLEYHGTTSVFCEIERNPYSWIYLPDQSFDAHRIICTGNFSETNNAPGKMTATVEFTDEINLEEINRQLAKIPFVPKYISHKFNKCTYPIQGLKTREMIQSFRSSLSAYNLFLTGRFALWEYFNMDVAMASAMQLAKELDDKFTESQNKA